LLVTQFASPPEQPDTFELIKNLQPVSGKALTPGRVFIQYYGVAHDLQLLFIDGRAQKYRLGLCNFSLGVGAFALLPYWLLETQ